VNFSFFFFSFFSDVLSVLFLWQQYSDDIPTVSAEVAEEVLKLGQEFGVERLVNICECLLGKRKTVKVPELAKQIESQLGKAEYSDLTFTVEGKLIPAHGIIVTARCQYFQVKKKKTS
jgi:hypothetical protein